MDPTWFSSSEKGKRKSPLAIKKTLLGITGPPWTNTTLYGGYSKEGNWSRLSEKANFPNPTCCLFSHESLPWPLSLSFMFMMNLHVAHVADEAWKRDRKAQYGQWEFCKDMTNSAEATAAFNLTCKNALRL